jgi:hypothetical protein
MSQNKQTNIFNEIKKSRSFIIDTILTSIMLSLAINFLTEWFLNFKDYKFLIMGLIFLIIGFFLFFLRLLKYKEYMQEIDGFFIYDKDENSIIKIPFHEINSDMKNCFKSAIKEDEAIEIIWNNNPISSYNFNENNKPESMYIIEELIEYLIISELDVLLSDYNYENEDIKAYKRKDLLEICESNRFLNLFSKEPNKRSSFLKSENPPRKDSLLYSDGKNHKSELVMAYSENGARFSRISLNLPKKTNILRKGRDLLLDLNICTLNISTRFEGYNTFIHNEFFEQILNINYEWQKYPCYQYNILSN